MKKTFAIFISVICVTLAFGCAKPIIVDTTKPGTVKITGLPAKGSIKVGDIEATSDSNDDPVTWTITKLSSLVDALLGRSDLTISP